MCLLRRHVQVMDPRIQSYQDKTWGSFRWCSWPVCAITTSRLAALSDQLFRPISSFGIKMPPAVGSDKGFQRVLLEDDASVATQSWLRPYGIPRRHRVILSPLSPVGARRSGEFRVESVYLRENHIKRVNGNFKSEDSQISDGLPKSREK